MKILLQQTPEVGLLSQLSTKPHTRQVSCFLKNFLLLIVFLASHSAIADKPDNSYLPQTSLSLKGGNARCLGRVSVLVPVIQNTHNLFFGSLIGMADTQSNQEGNFGVGFRHLFVDKGILGVYGFYDIRRSARDNVLLQWTVGSEYLAQDYEFRVNGYIPQSQPTVLSKNDKMKLIRTDGARVALIQVTEVQRQEKALGGFDVEAGYSFGLKPFMLYGAYYHFAGKHAPTIAGVRSRAEFKFNQHISVEAELQYDKVRGTQYFLGSTLTVAIGKKSKDDNNTDLNSLYQKMTKFPVRDVDVVHQDITVVVDNNPVNMNAIVIDSAAELRKIGNEDEYPLNGIYVQTADIDLEGSDENKHRPIGTEEAPFAGQIYANLEKNQVSIHNLHINDQDMQSLGLLGVIDGATIQGLKIIDASVTGGDGVINVIKCVGILVGRANQSQVINNFTSGDVRAGAHSYASNLVGGANSNNIITHNHTTGNATASGEWSRAGNLVGNANSNNIITHNHTTGNTTTSGTYSYAGNLVGGAYSNNIITHNHTTGDASAEGVESNAGNLVGCAAENNIIVYNHSIGDASAEGYESCAGNLAGYVNDINTIMHNHTTGDASAEGEGSRAGNLVGYAYNNTITHNHITGNATANGVESNAGNLVGFAYDNNTITHNYIETTKNNNALLNSIHLVGHTEGGDNVIQNNYVLASDNEPAHTMDGVVQISENDRRNKNAFASLLSATDENQKNIWRMSYNGLKLNTPLKHSECEYCNDEIPSLKYFALKSISEHKLIITSDMVGEDLMTKFNKMSLYLGFGPIEVTPCNNDNVGPSIMDEVD